MSTIVSPTPEAIIYGAGLSPRSEGKLVARRLDHGRLQLFASDGHVSVSIVVDTDDFARWAAVVQPQPPKDKE